MNRRTVRFAGVVFLVFASTLVLAQEPGEGGIVGTGRSQDDSKERFERPDFPDRVERFETVVPELPSPPEVQNDFQGTGAAAGFMPPNANTGGVPK